MTTAIEHLGVDPGNAAIGEFKREPRYIVFKLKDVNAYLKAAEIRQLEKIGSTIAVNRAFHGKPPFNAVVVEQDWPEFDLVWQMIEARMTGTGNDHRRTVACTAACAGIPTEKLAGIGSAIGERASELIARAEQRDELLAASADDIRADGWSVAVHNDYRLDGTPHTFWLFTKDGMAMKGEGYTDAIALNQVRVAIAKAKP